MVTAVDCQELLERLVIRMAPENGDALQENNSHSDEGKNTTQNGKSEEPESMEMAVAS